MKEKILIIEDEKDIVKMLEYNLKKEGFVTVASRDGEAALAAARKELPDLILLDIMLPGMDGLEVCKSLKGDRKTARIPVIMLTAKSQESDKIVGLELGADDYVTKPFSPRELIARIKAVIRRGKAAAEPKELFSAGGLAVDYAKISVSVKGKPVELTSKEFELLKALIAAKGRVLSRDYLLNAVWGIDGSLEIETRTVDVHIKSLREKLGRQSSHIITVEGVGYRFE